MIPCAVAQNIQTMLVGRFLDGLAGSAFLSVAGGTVGDMFAKHVSATGLTRRDMADDSKGAFRPDDGVYRVTLCRVRMGHPNWVFWN
jgi:hypothetical protein